VHICFKTQFYLFIFFLLQFVADGVFFAELNELLTRELAEDGYSGVEVRVTPMRTEIIIRATRTQNVLGMISAHF
jgi:small subunit ribosomal protein S3e